MTHSHINTLLHITVSFPVIAIGVIIVGFDGISHYGYPDLFLEVCFLKSFGHLHWLKVEPRANQEPVSSYVTVRCPHSVHVLIFPLMYFLFVLAALDVSLLSLAFSRMHI